MPIKIIIDTDIATDVDDAIAIAFALRRPELDVKAITTVHGPVQKRAEILARLLAVAGRADVPYATGRALPQGPLSEERRRKILDEVPNQHPFVRAGEPLPPPTCATADELLERAIEENAGDIWLVAIGAMTNAAALIRERPDLAAKLKGIACMAGDPHTHRPEWNVVCDPEAAREVFRSGLVRFMGTFDITRQVVMGDASLDRLRTAGTPLANAMLELIGLWQPLQKHKAHPVVYDVCPLAWLFAPQHFGVEPMPVDVVLTEGPQRGCTIPAAAGPALGVSNAIDSAAVLEMLMTTLEQEPRH